MANKIKLKKYLLCTFLIVILLLGIFLCVNLYEYYTYRKDVNNKLAEIINEVAEKYPEVTKKDISRILNDKGVKSENKDIKIYDDKNEKIDNKNVLEEIGIDIDNESVLLENDS